MRDELGRIEVGERIGRDEVLARLESLSRRLDARAEEIDANLREYEQLASAQRGDVAEYDRLRAKLVALDAEGGWE